MRIILILNIILRLFIGGMMIFGGLKKFSAPMPEPTAMVEKIKAGEDLSQDLTKLKIRNYVFGMKQTNYFWQFLGFVELLVGLLLLSQIFGFLGAVLAMPLTVNIFLFHLFLEPHEIGELIEVAGLLVANIWLIAVAYPQWRGLLFTKIWPAKTAA